MDKGPQDPVDEQALESNSDDTGDGEMEVERVEQHAGGGGVEQYAEGGGVVAGGGGVGGCAVGVVQEVHVEHVIVQHVYAADKVAHKHASPTNMHRSQTCMTHKHASLAHMHCSQTCIAHKHASLKNMHPAVFWSRPAPRQISN